MDLPEVAALVAEALGLTPTHRDGSGGWRTGPGLGTILYRDGSNLTDPYWRCACEDWLHTNGWCFSMYSDWAECWKVSYSDGLQLHIGTPFAESPARLVAEVWRKMNETQKANR